MQTCKGCRQQQTNDALCLVCLDDLSAWLRSIPDLYHELSSVRLPGSVSQPGPRQRSSSTASAAPVRLEVLDLLDRGETLRRLWEWTDDKHFDVRAICDGFRHHLLSIVTFNWAGDFYRAMRALCRDLGRAVGEVEDRPVGKCSEPIGDEICRGQLFRTADGTAVYCRRCGSKPDLLAAQVWVSLEQAARLVGRPIETVRTWYKRGRLTWPAIWLDHEDPSAGWSGPIGPQPFRMAWLPSAVRLADGSVTTLPPRGDTVNHGLGAEPSPHTGQPGTAGLCSGPDADVLGREAGALTQPGNVTLSTVATVGKAVAPDPSQDAQPFGRIGWAAGTSPGNPPEKDPAASDTAGSDS